MKQTIVATVRIKVDRPDPVEPLDVASAISRQFGDAEVSVRFDGGFDAGFQDADSRHRYPDNSGQ